MNLYLIEQTVNDDWDTYDSAVVAAPDENTARYIHPDGDGGLREEDWWNRTWTTPEHVTVRLIGTATEDTTQGVICASFNAG